MSNSKCCCYFIIINKILFKEIKSFLIKGFYFGSGMRWHLSSVKFIPLIFVRIFLTFSSNFFRELEGIFRLCVFNANIILLFEAVCIVVLNCCLSFVLLFTLHILATDYEGCYYNEDS